MPFTTTEKRVIGEDLTLILSKLATGATPISNWTSFNCKIMKNKHEASAATAKFEQIVMGRNKATGSVKGFAGGSETMGNLPQPGDELQSIALQTITEGADLIADLGDEAKYGKIVVTTVDYTQTDKPGEWSFEFESGLL